MPNVPLNFDDIINGLPQGQFIMDAQVAATKLITKKPLPEFSVGVFSDYFGEYAQTNKLDMSQFIYLLKIYYNHNEPYKEQYDSVEQFLIGNIFELNNADKIKHRINHYIKTQVHHLVNTNNIFSYKVDVCLCYWGGEVLSTKRALSIEPVLNLKQKDNVINKEKKVMAYKAPKVPVPKFEVDYD